jgi:hypothetical protein
MVGAMPGRRGHVHIRDASSGRNRPTGRRERRRAEIRERLYRAAVQLFMTRGLQATRVKDSERGRTQSILKPESTISAGEGAER